MSPIAVACVDCGALSDQGRCPQHRKEHELTRRKVSSGWEWSQIGQRVKRRDGIRCVDCGSSLDLEVDHVIPLAEGGTNEMDNLKTRCRPCHLQKHRGGQ